MLPPVNELCFPGCVVWTDELNVYKKLKPKYKHGTVCHKREVLSPTAVCTNVVESLWTLIKKGIRKRWKGARGEEEAEKHKFYFCCSLFNCRKQGLDPWCEILRVMRDDFPVTV